MKQKTLTFVDYNNMKNVDDIEGMTKTHEIHRQARERLFLAPQPPNHSLDATLRRLLLRFNLVAQVRKFHHRPCHVEEERLAGHRLEIGRKRHQVGFLAR